ncbi:hypothetical protein FRC01_007525, partial [Tulasnella sp. 417]
LCDTSINGKPIQKGDRVFVSLVDAAYDPCFKNPDNIVTPSRAKGLVNDGLSRLLGPDWIAEVALPAIKNVFSLGGMGRFPGSLGHLSGIKSELPGGTKFREYLGQSQQITTTPPKLLLAYTNEAPILSPSTSTGTLRPDCTPLSVDWNSTPSNASDGSDSAQPSSQSGSDALDGDGGGAISKPSSGTGNAGGQPQGPPAVDYKPEFVGGVGGGANDPEYDYKNPEDETTGAGDDDGPIWTPLDDLAKGEKGRSNKEDDALEQAPEAPATTPGADEEVYKLWRPELSTREPPATTELTPGADEEVYKSPRPELSTSEPLATTQPKLEDGEESFKPGRPELPIREDSAQRTSPEENSAAPNDREPSLSDGNDQGSSQSKPKDPESSSDGATSQSSKPSDNLVQTEKDQGAATAGPNGSDTSGGTQESSRPREQDQTPEPSKHETAVLPSNPGKTTQPEKPAEQTPLPPQHEPTGFTHTAPVGNLRKGTPWDDYTFPPNPNEATITVVKVFHDAGGLRAIQLDFAANWSRPVTTMNNGVGGVNNLNRDLVNVFQQGGYASTGQMHALQQQRFLQQQQQHHQQQMTAASQLNISDPSGAANPLLEGQIANPLDNFGGSSGGLSYSLDPAQAAKQMAALQAAGRSRALSHSASGPTSSQFPPSLNPAVAGLQPGGNTTTTAPPPAMDPQMQHRQLQHAQSMILSAMLNNRPPNFLPQLAEVMASKGTPLPQTITGVPSPTFDPTTSPMRGIQPGSSPGTIQFSGKELDLHMLMIWIIQKGGFHKIQFDEAAWEGFLNHIGLPRRQPSANPSQPPVDLVQILQRHYFILLLPFEPQWTKVVQQKVMMTVRQQQHAALQQAMAANGSQALNPTQLAMVNPNLHNLGGAANPQLGLQTPNQAALQQQQPFGQQQNLLAQQQARNLQQQQMAQQLMTQHQPSNILGPQQHAFPAPNGTGPQAVPPQQNAAIGMPPPPVPDVASMGSAGLDQSQAGVTTNGIENATTPDAQMGDSDSEARKRKRTDTGDMDGKRPRLDEQPPVADGIINGTNDTTAMTTSSSSPTRLGSVNGQPQTAQPPSGPRMKIQYRPLFRQLNTYGGRNLAAIERE